MDFISDLLDTVPLVGCAKGVVHIACGEKEKGRKAVYKSTRSALIMVGGGLGGPAGAMVAALATDATTSVLMKKETGLINCCKNIGDDIEAKRNPTGSILVTCLQLGLDGASGLAGSSGAMGNASRKTMQMGGEQVIQKTVRISADEAARMVTRNVSKRAAETVYQGWAYAGVMVAQTQVDQVQRIETESRERREMEREIEREKWARKKREREEKIEREKWERKTREMERESEREKWEWKKREMEREIEREKWERKKREMERESEREKWEWKKREMEREIEREKWERKKREMERESERKKWEQTNRECREREHRERRERETEQQKSKNQEEYKKREQQANGEKPKHGTSGTSPGSSQPPQGNKDNNRRCKEKNKKSLFDTFMEILRVILKRIYGTENEPISRIFEGLPREQRRYLSKVLKRLEMYGTLEVAIELVIRMFKQHLRQDISFLNFLSLLEFVQTYIMDEWSELINISSESETAETKMKSTERRAKIISEIVSDKDIVEKLIELFEGLKTEIRAETAEWNPAFPQFRDIFAAAYHYFKHRKVPESKKILSVKEYYDWIRKFLEELKKTQKFTELKGSNVQSYEREVFVPIFHRRFKIALKVHGDNITLGSAFVVESLHKDDKEDYLVALLAETITMVFMAVCLLFILKTVFFYGPMVLLNTLLIVSNSIAFIVKLLFGTLLFFFACFIFLLKVLLNVLLVLALLWFLFFLST